MAIKQFAKNMIFFWKKARLAVMQYKKRGNKTIFLGKKKQRGRLSLLVGLVFDGSFLKVNGG